MATHTPAQAIQELVNHTAVLTERLVGLQTEVRKGMNMTPEWGNALTQVVGDTKRMLQAMEHLARLPAFHLDREGLNAAVAAGVQQGLASAQGMGSGGDSLIAIIENNSRQLEEAKSELAEAKKRMDTMLEEMQTTKAMTPEGRQKFFMQFAPIVGMWSVGLLLAGLMLGRGCAPDPAPPAPPAPPAVTSQQQPVNPAIANSGRLIAGSQFTLARLTEIFEAPSENARKSFNGPIGMRVTIVEVRQDGWLNVSFALGQGRTGSGWLKPGSLP
jgi:hypothetical protein